VTDLFRATTATNSDIPCGFRTTGESGRVPGLLDLDDLARVAEQRPRTAGEKMSSSGTGGQSGPRGDLGGLPPENQQQGARPATGVGPRRSSATSYAAAEALPFWIACKSTEPGLSATPADGFLPVTFIVVALTGDLTRCGGMRAPPPDGPFLDCMPSGGLMETERARDRRVGPGTGRRTRTWWLDVAAKMEYIERLAADGLRRIEAVSS